jgi:phage head maturation protease
MNDVDAIVQHYTGWTQATAYGPDPLGVTSMLARAPERIRKALLTPTCAGCGQTIGETIRRVVINGSVFHPSCGAKRRNQASTVRVRPQVLCTLQGVVVPHDQPCAIFDEAGGVSAHEQFRSGCFDDSLARGPYFLKLNHAVRLEGRWTRVCSEAGELRFGFELYDDAYNRQLKSDIERGAIRHCSIAFKQQSVRAHYGGSTLVIDEATLSEISLLRDRRPAWYDTWVRIA